jgi:hypothetical protein
MVPSLPVVGGTVGWFDEVALSSGQNSGARGVIRINEHRYYKWTINCDLALILEQELMGAWALLTLASRLSIPELYVQGDSKIVIDWLWARDAFRWSLWSVGRIELLNLSSFSKKSPSCMCIEKKTKKQIAYQNRRSSRFPGK